MNSDPNNNLNGQVPNAGVTPVTPGVPTTPATPAAPTVPSAVQTTPSVSVPTTAPAQPTQQRVQLVNDEVALKAISPIDMAQKNEKKEENGITSENDGKVVEENNNGGGKFQTFFLFVLFGGLLAFIIYIDDITLYLETRKDNNNQIEEKITTGTLVCDSEKSTSNMDYTYTAKFEFRDSKLKGLTILWKLGEMLILMIQL